MNDTKTAKRNRLSVNRLEAILLLKQEGKDESSELLLSDEINKNYQKALRHVTSNQEQTKTARAYRVLTAMNISTSQLSGMEESKETKDSKFGNNELIKALDKIYIESPENYWDFVTRGRSDQEIAENITLEPKIPSRGRSKVR
jgi:soluble cytochrome b562